MGAVVLLLVGLGAIAAAVSTGSVTTPEEGGGFGNGDPLSTVLTGADFAVLLVGVLGALTGAREYGSRMIWPPSRPCRGAGRSSSPRSSCSPVSCFPRH